MPTLRNTSPYGALDVPLIRQTVDAGAEFDVTAEHAAILLEQDGNFEAVDDTAKRIRADIETARAAAEHAESGEPPAASARKAEWVAYAAAQGADPAEAEAMTKEQLVAAYGATEEAKA